LQNNNITAQVIGLALSLILAIGLVGIPTALASTTPPDYTNVEDSSVEVNNGKMKLTATTEGDIPKKADDFINSVLGFGFAWLDGNEGIVAAIHPDFDDSNQNPNAWHTHTVTLDGDNCVTVEDSEGGVIIKGNTITLQLSKQFTGNIEPDQAVSFKLVEDESCDSGAAVEVL
jgi:hypothetical protein